ncbi:MAG: hypothetical protein M3314_03125 [Actinomycetota bacterium]|nr:hypothetical protein [Actinomycetota bacterium]
MILLLVPVLCAVVGLILYAALRATGAFGEFAGSLGSGSGSGSGSGRTTYRSSAPSGFRERLQEIPSGWFIAVIAVSGVWILGWLIVLAVGLNLLT